MTKHFLRTRGDLVVGFWALAPAVAIPLLFMAWWHRINSITAHWADMDVTYWPLADWMPLALLGVGALYLIALVVVIRDVWLRPLDQNVRIMWTILTLLFAPFGGVVYWVVACHSSQP